MKSFIDKLILKFILRSKLNFWLGKVFFKNAGGLVSNLIGSYIKKRDPKKAKKYGFKKQSHPKADFLKENGVLLENNINNEEIIKDISKLWENYTSERPHPADGRLELSSADMHEEKVLNKFIPLLEKLITKDIQSLLESYFGCYSRIINYHIYRNKKPMNISDHESYGATANWHNDGSTSESIKLFFMLSNISKENGPMEAISINDSRKVLTSNNFFYPDPSGKTNDFIRENAEIISLQGKAGSIFFALTNDVLHRATIPNEKTHRDLIVFYITSSSKKRSVYEQLKEAKHREIYGLKRLTMT